MRLKIFSAISIRKKLRTAKKKKSIRVFFTHIVPTAKVVNAYSATHLSKSYPKRQHLFAYGVKLKN
jgi:hypothetical protein